MNNIQKIGGVAAICEALIYISAFIFFGVFFNFPVEASHAQQLAFLTENQLSISIINLTMYVIFGILLTVLVLAVHQRLKVMSYTLSQTASIFGFIWVGLVISSGMIANIGLESVINMAANNTEQAMNVWLVINIVVDGIGGGNEIVGGLWVLLLSVAALKAREFSIPLNYLGLFIGLVGIFTVYPADVLTEIFGVGQILWFAWLGVTLLRSNSNNTTDTERESTREYA